MTAEAVVIGRISHFQSWLLTVLESKQRAKHKQIWPQRESSLVCSESQMERSHHTEQQIARYSPWTSARWWGRLLSRAGFVCSWAGSWWYLQWAPQSPETAAYPPEEEQAVWLEVKCCACNAHVVASCLPHPSPSFGLYPPWPPPS